MNCQSIICKTCGVKKQWDDFIMHILQQGTSTCGLARQNKRKIVPCASATIIKSNTFD
jgi:hypothetical protein